MLTEQMGRYKCTATELQDLAERQGRTTKVHPVQLYAAMNGLLLAILLNECSIDASDMGRVRCAAPVYLRPGSWRS